MEGDEALHQEYLAEGTAKKDGPDSHYRDWIGNTSKQRGSRLATRGQPRHFSLALSSPAA